MFDEPDEPKSESARDPKLRSAEKAEEYRMYAELFAVFEGTRKFDHEVRTDLAPDRVRHVQKTMAALSRKKHENTPVLLDEVAIEAGDLLAYAHFHDIPSGHYHVYRRPGEVMIVRWLEDEQVAQFYERMQAHFDAGFDNFRKEERSNLGWRSDEATSAYLDALDAVEEKMEDRYLRKLIREHGIHVLSTFTTDEMNIRFITEQVMSLEPADLVGAVNAPDDDADEAALAWFFKLFALRGVTEKKVGVERMCFFVFMQKSDEDAFDFGEG